MDFYPQDFPQISRALVEAEEILSRRAFLKVIDKASSPPEKEALVRQHILRIFLVFAKEACQLGLQGVWGVDHIRSVVKEFLRRLTIDIEYGVAFPYGIWTMTSNWNGSILAEAQRAFEQSAEWAEYDDLLLRVAKAQARISKQAVARMEPLESGHSKDSAQGADHPVHPQSADVAGNGVPSSHTVGVDTIKKRRTLVRQYNRENKLTMADLSRRVAISVTGIQAIIRGDRSRYSQGSCDSFLKKIGVRRGQWGKE